MRVSCVVVLPLDWYIPRRFDTIPSSRFVSYQEGKKDRQTLSQHTQRTAVSGVEADRRRFAGPELKLVN